MEIVLVIAISLVVVILGSLYIVASAMRQDRLIKSLRQVVDSTIDPEFKVEMIKLILWDDGKNPPKVQIDLIDEDAIDGTAGPPLSGGAYERKTGDA